MGKNRRGRTNGTDEKTKDEGDPKKERLERAYGELSIELFLEAILTYMIVQAEAAKKLFEKEPEERTPEAYIRLLNELTEEFSNSIDYEEPSLVPPIRGQNISFQDILKHNLNRKD